MTDKPLEWDKYNAARPSSGESYQAYKGQAWYRKRVSDFYTPVPGPYDGTIETAKQRCEEHRRKVSP